MSSKLLNQRASEDEASRGPSPSTASSDEDSRAMIGLIAAAAASAPPAAAAAAPADSTSTPPTKAKAGKKKKAKAAPAQEAAALADLASSASGKSPARQQHQLPMFLSSKSILVICCAMFSPGWHILEIYFRPHRISNNALMQNRQLTTALLSITPCTYIHHPAETYHMISRCDPDVATWSATGDSFIIKNVEQCKSSAVTIDMQTVIVLICCPMPRYF